MKKVYISADMEGVTGVTHSQDVIPGRAQYERLVNEAHDVMRNILLEDLDPRAEVIVGQRKPYSMMQGFEGADLVFFVGYHARAGTEGVLSHTFDSPTVVTGVWLNGEPCSEARMNATLAGLKGIPVGLVTGDDLTCAEAESLYAGVQTARVKTAVDRYTARCLSPQVARERIREAALRAGEKGDLTPYTPEPPYSFTIEFATASPAASVLFFPGPERVDDRRVSWTHEDYETAFKMFIGVMRLSRSDPDYG
jgi:D-amino peptidase